MNQRAGTYIIQKIAGESYTAGKINSLFEQDFHKITSLGRARFSCQQTLEYMKKLPQVTVPFLASKLGVSAPTARSALESMVKLGIIEEVSGKKRDKTYVYRKYLNILEDGAEPFKMES